MPREYTPEQREAQRKLTRAHYAANKAYYKEKARKHNKLHLDTLREYVIEYLENHPCVDCNNSDPRVLEFDHVRGKKEFNISDALRTNNWVNLEKLQNEIEKCDVRCANCHRIVTVERGGWYKSWSQSKSL